MIYVFDFELSKGDNFVLEEYSCKYNGEVVDRKEFDENGLYRFLKLYNSIVTSSTFSKIDKEDIIVMGWK